MGIPKGPWQRETNGSAFDFYSPERSERFAILLGMNDSPKGELEDIARAIAEVPAMVELLKAASNGGSLSVATRADLILQRIQGESK